MADDQVAQVEYSVGVLVRGTDQQKQDAAHALGDLAGEGNKSRTAIAQAGGIAPLVALARDGNDKQKEYAAHALKTLAMHSADNKAAIREAGGIAPLVALARDGNDKQKEYAAHALKALAMHSADNLAAIAQAGGIAPLVALARDGNNKQKENAADALHWLTPLFLREWAILVAAYAICIGLLPIGIKALIGLMFLHFSCYLGGMGRPILWLLGEQGSKQSMRGGS
jgi:hypothetical protein